MAVITISRQFGAGGRTLGKMIAEQYGYTFADTEIIKKVAEIANVSPGWVESMEREAGTRVLRIVSKMVAKPLVERVLKNERGYLDEKLYLDYLIVIIAQMAEEGDVVILGRGSQYILDDHPDAVHILLINSYENRVKFMMDRYEMPAVKAARVVSAEDKRRTNLYRKLGQKDYDNPSLYHLVLNMGRLTLDQARDLVVQLVPNRHFTK